MSCGNYTKMCFSNASTPLDKIRCGYMKPGPTSVYTSQLSRAKRVHVKSIKSATGNRSQLFGLQSKNAVTGVGGDMSQRLYFQSIFSGLKL